MMAETDLIEKYKAKLEQQLGSNASGESESREYKEFRKELIKGKLGTYEKACNFAGKILNLKLEQQLGSNASGESESREYKEFRKELIKGKLGTYEKACNFAGKILNLK